MKLARDPRIKGECKRCGACCVLGRSFHYQVTRDKEDEMDGFEATNDIKDEIFIKQHPIFGHIIAYEPCVVYDHCNKRCKNHENKKFICKLWPIVKEDLEKVDCKGFWYDNTLGSRF